MTLAQIVQYDTTASPSAQAHAQFGVAYNYFNRVLFNSELPMCFIILQRKKGTYGYFTYDKTFISRSSDQQAHELSMNPDGFYGRTDKDILSTLVHEMAHCWQQHYGSPSRNGYHNKEWAQKMNEIGLHPTDDGTPHGKQTGQRMTHIIIPGGLFDQVVDRLLGEGFKLDWESHYVHPSREATNLKIKYSCKCGQNIWAKPGIRAVCEMCNQPFKAQI